MTSMQEALTTALENPVAKPHPAKRARKGQKRKASQASGPMVWGFFGIAASAIVFGVSRLLKSSPPSRQLEPAGDLESGNSPGTPQ